MKPVLMAEDREQLLRIAIVCTCTRLSQKIIKKSDRSTGPNGDNLVPVEISLVPTRNRIVDKVISPTIDPLDTTPYSVIC